jgi:hypothetical protein
MSIVRVTHIPEFICFIHFIMGGSLEHPYTHIKKGEIYREGGIFKKTGIKVPGFKHGDCISDQGGFIHMPGIR